MLENIRPSVVAEALYRSKVYTAEEALAVGMVNGILPQVHDSVRHARGRARVWLPTETRRCTTQVRAQAPKLRRRNRASSRWLLNHRSS